MIMHEDPGLMWHRPFEGGGGALYKDRRLRR